MLLQEEWYSRLARDGFDDIEDKSGKLRQYDCRNMLYENREMIYEFFYNLEHYLTNHPEIKQTHKTVLTLYSQGVYLVDIAQQTGIKLITVRTIIKRYKKRIFGI